MKIILTLNDPTPEPALIVFNDRGRIAAIDVNHWIEDAPAKGLSRTGVRASADPALTAQYPWAWEESNEDWSMQCLLVERHAGHWWLVGEHGAVFAETDDAELLAIDRSARRCAIKPLPKAS